MSWEESWNKFTSEQQFYRQEYGEILGEYLANSTAFRHQYYGEELRAHVESLQNYFGEDIPEHIQRAFVESNGWKDLILENLQSHDSKKLTEKIKKQFRDYLSFSHPFDFPYGEKEKSYIKVQTTGPRASAILGKSEKFKALVNFFGYNISRVDGSVVTLEPEWPETAEGIGGWGYHVTYNRQIPGAPDGYSVLDSIKEHGLRPKQQKSGRFYPSRVYMFFYGPCRTQEALSKLREDSKEINYSDNVWNSGHVAVIKFRIPDSLTWYRDSVMKGPAYFTYNSIPASCIERVWEFPSKEPAKL